MKDICILGAGGFVGTNLARFFGARAYGLTHRELDLLDQAAVDAFFFDKTFKAVFHCAVRGGSRLCTDQADVFHDNLRMFETVAKHTRKFEKLLYFSSGTRFDRTSADVHSIPADFYGFSKYVLEQRAASIANAYVLRIYGCFGAGESSTRFLSVCVREKYVKIAQDRYFDFIWIDDLCKVAAHAANAPSAQFPKVLNLVYAEKVKLSQLAELAGARYEIESAELGLSYTGTYSDVLHDSGLRVGIASLASKFSREHDLESALEDARQH